MIPLQLIAFQGTIIAIGISQSQTYILLRNLQVHSLDFVPTILLSSQSKATTQNRMKKTREQHCNTPVDREYEENKVISL